MKPTQVLNTLTEMAKDYRCDANQSVQRNSHMNSATGATIDQNDIDALLVDFINYVGVRCGADYALYTSDLGKR